MKFEQPLLPGRLLRRYKRFLADVELESGRQVTAHTANTGAMTGCAEPGSRVWLRDTANPTRKYPLSWELVETREGVMVGIHTAYANHLVAEAIETGVIDPLQGYASLRREPRYPHGNSRFDLLLSGHGRLPDCFVEVKNVTAIDDGVAIFPDAVTQRGAKHLQALADAVTRGYRAALCFCVQRGDAGSVRAAVEIDPHYAGLLSQVAQQGVEVLAYQADVSLEGIDLYRPLPVML